MNWKELSAKKKKIVKIAAVAVPLIVVVLLAYGTQRMECREVRVKFLNENESSYLDSEKIKSIVYKIYPKLKDMSMNEIQTDKIESAINKISYIEHADVYKSIGGIVTISVLQKVALVRIFDTGGRSYFIDTNGGIFPISKNFTPPVIVASGKISNKISKKFKNALADSAHMPILNQIYTLAKKIESDPFLNAQFKQIFVTEKNELEIVPAVGPHIVLLGSTERIEQKFMRLKHFYKNVLPEEGFNKYGYINLKYENQIVCTKREKT